MSNFDTGFIKFLTLLLVLGLMSGLTACQKTSSHSKVNAPAIEATAIIGGENATADFKMANKVIYLSLGTEKKITPFGVIMTQKENCTATAISRRVLLTAAHCVQKYKPENIQAVLTLNLWNHPLNMNEWIQVDKVIIHEHFINNADNVENDLALLRLSKDISDDRISTIADTSQLSSDDFKLLAIGYGQTSALIAPPVEVSNDGTPRVQLKPSLLNYVMKTVENFEPSNQVFKIEQGDMTGICHGDSGGPGYIFDPEKNDYFILGVTSYVSIFPDEKAQRDPNGIYNTCIGRGNYTNLLLFKDWITNAQVELLAK